MPTTSTSRALDSFSPAAKKWFTSAFESPTAAQEEAWESIASGEHTLVVAPTGSGKTLAAFFWALDQLAQRGESEAGAEEEKPGVKVLYVSPLKALGVDVERNLRSPLAGLREASSSLGLPVPDISVGVRSGDTPASERRRLITNPPDILITTPESLYLLLTSKGAETLRGVETVIIDEVHALAGNKRGAHLALSLERLDELLETPAARIGLSATVEPAEEVARFLGGAAPVKIVRPPSNKEFEITVEVPAEDMTNPPVEELDFLNANSDPKEVRLGSMWPAIENSLYDRIVSARSTIVFTNSRRLAERLTSRLNEVHADRLATAEGDARPNRILAKAHHGSVAKEARAQVEEELKSGELRCVVATASLELGIDMGAVDQVIQIDPPPSVSAGLQRLGRSGHSVGAVSKAIFYPTHRSKLLEVAVIAERMTRGQIETMVLAKNPLDVLAQQTIAEAVRGPLDVEGWYQTVRRSAPFSNLPYSAYLAVLDLVSGKYPSSRFASLRARLDWDRAEGTLTARPGAQRLAVTGGGTIPDRGTYRVVVAEEEGFSRVGELDEEMVHETRVGEVFTLGTTPWRVRRITRDAVEVEPAFGTTAKTPFWRGDAPARPLEVGQALGRLAENAASATEGVAAALARIGFDQFAVQNTLAYVAEQNQAMGSLPSDTNLVVERTRDEVGDWLYILHSPLGLKVHAPWALAIDARLQAEWGLEGKSVPSNDGIIVRLPDFDEAGDGPHKVPAAEEVFLFDSGEIEDLVAGEITNSAVFAARFREAAARALVLGAGKPGKRSPLWQQRLRAANLLEVARDYPQFPITLEAVREVLTDVYDTRALADLMAGIERRRVSLREVTTETPTPFARSLLFGYVGEFIYSGDVPASERAIAALSVDPRILRELLGEVPLSQLLEADAVLDVQSELQRTKDGWKAFDLATLQDLLRALGPLTPEEIEARVAPTGEITTQQLVQEALDSRALIEVRFAGAPYFAAIEDAGLLVAALGASVPAGVPKAFLEPPEDPVSELLWRYLATNGPVTKSELGARFGLSAVTLEVALAGLEKVERALRGSFRPEELAGGAEEQFVWAEVLDRVRSRSLALLRGGVEAVSGEAYALFLAAWQHLLRPRLGLDGTFAVIEQLSGLPLPASTWESLVLPARIQDFEVSFLDQLVGNGEVTWSGAGAIGPRDGWVQFTPAGIPPKALQEGEPLTQDQEAIVDVLSSRGALFAPALQAALEEAGTLLTESQLAEAIWGLVWAGRVTSDSLTALRARVSGRRSAVKTAQRRPRARSLTRRHLAALQVGSGVGGTDPTLAGRWSLVQAASPQDHVGPGALLALRAAELLDRYGVVTRGSAVGENFPGGFSALYRIYSDLELSGTLRRGYFVKGLGGAQFALPGAVEELRSAQDDLARETGGEVLTLSSTDPANPYGASLSWPDCFTANGNPRRSAGSLITLVAGVPVLYVERGGRSAIGDPDAGVETRSEACRSLVRTAKNAGLSSFTIEKLNGEPVSRSPWADSLMEAGFERVPRGLVFRKPLRDAVSA